MDSQKKTQMRDCDPSILCVGTQNLYISNLVNEYPTEDLGHRCLEQHWQRGGNASNDCTILSLLGFPCRLMATLAKSHELSFLLDDLAKYNINTEFCVQHSNCVTPVSIGIINKQNGSRTIIHSNQNLPEITFKDFQNSVDLTKNSLKWIHFEGRRSVVEIRQMLQYIDCYNKDYATSDNKIITSIEIEKRNPELVNLCRLADYIFISKEHAMMVGINNKEDAVQKYLQYTKKGAAVICAWGETGASAKRASEPMVSCSCYPPEKVVDTLGAGDTFVATAISVLNCQVNNDNELLLKAIDFGCKVAGAKCGMEGFDGLKELFGKNS